MKSRINKILTIITAVTFVAALAINVQASFNDPFAGMSDEAVVLTTSDDETTGNCPGGSCSYYESGWVYNPNTGHSEWKEKLVCTACCAEGQSAHCDFSGCECN